MDFIQLILRSLQLIFVVINIGLTAGLIKGQVIGGSPSSTNYVMFAAAWGGITVIAGFLAVFIYSIQGLIMAIIDGLAVVVYLIGAVVFAAKLGVHSCQTHDTVLGWPSHYIFNPITSGGTAPGPDNTIIVGGNVRKQCEMAQADDAFMFFALACFIASLVMDFIGGEGFGRRKQEEYV